jgi:hypothetical protein
MSFFSGRVTFARFRVNGPAPGLFGQEHLDHLQAHTIGKQRIASSDGPSAEPARRGAQRRAYAGGANDIEVGWLGGDHILDTSFDLAKNIVNDTLHFSFRVDSVKIPADLLRAYAAIELQALAGKNPSGLPSNRQRREAKETARQRLESEAQDGRYIKRKSYPILWDAQSNELLVGTTSVTLFDRLHQLFEHTFGVGFEPLTAGRLAFHLAESRGQTRGIDDSTPSAFLPGLSASEVSWIFDEHSRDFLGNEYLLWLWYRLENEGDVIPLSDGTEATVMLSQSLLLECPRAQTGKESITHEGPTRLPEARRAIQAGKLPRKAGMIVVRHDSQYDLALNAETLAVSSARLPAPEASEERARLEERVTQIRHLVETLDLLYDAFGQKRASEEWSKELVRMQKWLQREERNGRMAATG